MSYRKYKTPKFSFYCHIAQEPLGYLTQQPCLHSKLSFIKLMSFLLLILLSLPPVVIFQMLLELALIATVFFLDKLYNLFDVFLLHL